MKQAEGSNQSWGGRFKSQLHRVAAKYSQSISFDKRLARIDIRGSMAHVRMLVHQSILSEAEGKVLQEGLTKVLQKEEKNELNYLEELEDIHMNIEHALTEEVGPVGGKLHTGRSRNDQVATDMRLFAREACDTLIKHLDVAISVLLTRAEANIDALLPGYTHLQRAQPVRLAHHLLAWCEMLERDRSRLVDARARLNFCPLGAGALAGTPFPIDRNSTAQDLQFTAPCANSLDAVADRDFLIEFLSVCANCAVHLSRIAEELVLWSSQEFAFIEMSDAFSTGSSMMPQKKNPDMAELVRGKTARVVGSLMSLLVLMKSLPLAYNRDMQEDKEPVFDAFDTLSMSLEVFAAMMATAHFHTSAMRDALRGGYVEATEIADYLAQKGIPFREAHHIAGQIVAYAIERQKTLDALSLDEMRRLSPLIEEDLFAVIEHESMVERRASVGAPNRREVTLAIDTFKRYLQSRSSSSLQKGQELCEAS